MPRVTIATVEHVARLAHLSLAEAERETFARQLDEVLAYAESIQTLDTEGASALTHAGGDERFRADVPHESLSRDAALSAAPDPGDGLFRVPRILGG